MGLSPGKVYNSNFVKPRHLMYCLISQNLPSMHLYVKAGGRLPLYNCGTQRTGGGCGRGEQFCEVCLDLYCKEVINFVSLCSFTKLMN